MSILALLNTWSHDWIWTYTFSEHVFCKCASVSGTEVYLLHIAMYCWKMNQ